MAYREATGAGAFACAAREARSSVRIVNIVQENVRGKSVDRAARLAKGARSVRWSGFKVKILHLCRDIDLAVVDTAEKNQKS